MNNYVFDYDQYKKRIYSKSSFSFTAIILITILLLGVYVYINPRGQNKKFYFIQIDKFQTYQKALELTTELENNKMFCLIYFDENYHVLSQFFLNYKSAKNSLKKIKANLPNAKIFSLSNVPFTYQKELNKTQNSHLKNFSNKCFEILKKLTLLESEFSNSNYETINTKIKNLKEDFNEVYSDLISSLKQNSIYNTTKDKATKMNEQISTLTHLTKQELDNKFKFVIINFAITYYEFLSCF